MSQFLPRAASDGSARPAHPSNKLRNLLDLPQATTDVELTIRAPLRHLPRFILTFTDLTYKVNTPKKSTNTKTLLNSISGEAREGEIMAVLGASGSGKSTLIDALADRIARGSLQGSITLNGDPIDRKLFKSVSAYVMQDDLLFPMLTVEETLMFSAEFRLRLPTHKKKERVQILIDQLGLRSASKTNIGDEGHRGVSGGERRRVSIGINIIHDPVVLFLDEPTSGLDSTSAFMVVNVLRRIAESGSIVVMSVHQPSYRIMELIDRVMFLSGGRTVFNGSPRDIRPFFTEFGHTIPENENLTEFTLDVVRELELSPEGVGELVEFNRLWQFRKGSIRYDDDHVSFMKALESRGELAIEGARAVGGFANSFWKEMVVLSKRSFLNSWRLPELFATRLVVVLVTGFMFATVFWRLDSSPRGVQERIGFFAMAMSTTFFICAEALPIFLQERLIFLRETTYNTYRRSSYVFSNAIVAIPPLVILGIAFTVTTFFAVGLAGGLHGFLFYFLTILVSLFAGNSFATFLSGVVTQEQLGFTVVVATLSYYLLFSGFFINRNRIPIYWLWFHYVSLVKYPYEAISQSEFGNPNACFVRGNQMFDGSPLGNIDDNTKESLLNAISATLRFNITMEGCITTGPDILEQQGITQLNKWNCLWIAIAWGLLFRVLFYISLLFGGKNRRR